MRRGSIIALGMVAMLLVPGAVAVGSTTAGNKAAAQAAATQLLGVLQLPTGASKVASDPSRSSVLGGAPGAPASPALIDDHSFWRVSGSPSSVLSWVQAHPPAGGQGNENGFSGNFFGNAPSVSFTGFRFAPVKGVLTSRELTVEVAPAKGGGTALRADAEVVWFVKRLAADRVPAGIRTITITSRQLGKPPSAPITASAASKVRRIVSYVNQLPPRQPGVTACPDDRGPYVELQFRKAAGATPVAVATADGSGCGLVTLTVGGRQEPALTEGPQLIKWLSSLLGTKLS